MPIINFSHQKGGVGKSLLSYHLAYLLKDNYDVQLLDLDNQKSLSSIHKLRNHKLQQHSIPIKTVHSKHELSTSSIASMTINISLSIVVALICLNTPCYSWC